MELKLCPNCKSPFLADNKFCPRCGKEYEWNQESWANVTCLVLMILFAFFLMLLPLLMIMAMFFRW